MNKIHVLNEITANKIAAGEVVENPASVIKELVENSLDAGATRIEVKIVAGGVQLIRVSDNGSGMSADDVDLACKRYATSKITDIDDLESIDSFGFRGEALPSIAAISRFTIMSRESESLSGVELEVHGGAVLQSKTTSISPGTVIEVRDLFFNTPARRKFLRSERYEKAVVADTIVALALANPDVGFEFKDSDKVVFNYPRTRNQSERVRQIFGKEFSGLVPIETTKGEYTIRGFASKPELHKTNKSKQYFFVNKRFVRYPRMSFSLQEAYHGHLIHGTYPCAVLFIKVDPLRLDVNIHPQKREVKIEGERILQEMLYRAVREKLEPGSRSGDFSPVEQKIEYSLKQKASAFPVKEPGADFAAAQDNEQQTVVTTPEEGALSFQSELILADEKPFGVLKILGQIHCSYILCETNEGALLIDQHAAHERIIFEQLKEHFNGQYTPQQLFLFPVTLCLSHEENVILQEVLAILEKFGFNISDLGNNTYSIQSYPALFDKESARDIIQGVIDMYKEESQRKYFTDNIETVAAIMACKSRSIKAHQRLSEEEMFSLIRQLAHCENPGHCCHGRPTMITLSINELEKRFLRK
ncbi:MAG: DNA mismatch repair endonuclease MutL [Candidatus Omnitrophica bacterium]|nr:DNA mismatch repair endonuclease MutL [Candidatus Omnitrophota bacterium]